MCGIAGVLRYDGQARVTPGQLTAMTDRMAHRGPDGDGHWISPEGCAGLAHRRLTIIDLSHAADQPMPNEDGSIVVIFNGEIYNHAPLRAELIAAGHIFRTDHSDTEVLVHGYEEWGMAGLLPRLQGMFAFAVWDEPRKRLTLARDRVGIKPIYFAKYAGAFRFASEIKGLLADDALPRKVCRIALYHYLTYLTTPAPLTMFDGIYKLPCSTFLEIEANGKMSATRYWDAVPGMGIDPAALPKTEAARLDFYTEGVRARLERAVEKRMMSDVPYGAFLSGGIDSSANVALMDRYTDQPVNTFTVGFSDFKHLNELEHARLVADLFKTNHHEVLVGEEQMTGYLAELVHSQDEPLADWVCIPLHFVSELARKAGVKVIQVGEGSDEQFCGYGGYMKYLELHRRYFLPFQSLLPVPARKALAGAALALGRQVPSLAFYMDGVDRAARGREAFWSGAIAFWESQKKELLSHFAAPMPRGAEEVMAAGMLPREILVPDSFTVAQASLGPFDIEHPGADQLTRMIHSEFRLRLPELLLMRVDKITMASSLEARVPFLDHALVEFTMDIPETAKIAGGETKHLLKQAVRGLIPDEIIFRKKMGFNAPMSDWLRGEFGALAESEILNSPMLAEIGFEREIVSEMLKAHRSGRRDSALLIWVIYNLAAWHAHWIEGHA